MGGGGRKSFKCFSICNILKSCCFPMGGRSDNDAYWGQADGAEADMRRRMWPSDQDRGRWIAEPGIDRKASAFIDRFYESRVSSDHSERQTFAAL